MSTRIRNGKLYFRKTVTDETGKRHWLEHREPFKDSLSESTVVMVFKRFSEPHTAFLPLYLVYSLSVDPKVVYEAKMGDFEGLSIDADRVLRRHKNRITQSRLLFLHTEISDYLMVDYRTGKRISYHQMYYISRAIRREIDPEWSWRKWRFAKIS